MPRLELFPFRYRDRVTGRWVKARYVAERHEIAARFSEWEIAGPPDDLDGFRERLKEAIARVEALKNGPPK